MLSKCNDAMLTRGRTIDSNNSGLTVDAFFRLGAGEAVEAGWENGANARQAGNETLAAAGWDPLKTYCVDVVSSQRTACHACSKRFEVGEVRVGHSFRCRAYGTTVSRERWFHVEHCEAPSGGWCVATGYDALSEAQKAELDHPLDATPARRRPRRRHRAAQDPSYSTKRPKSALQRFAAACRLAIRADVEAFRAEFFRSCVDPRCPVTGEPLQPTTCHVHHHGERADEFHNLVRAFVRTHKLSLSRVEYLAGRLLDESLRDDFVAYHAAHAHLVVVSVESNLTHLRRDPTLAASGVAIRMGK